MRLQDIMAVMGACQKVEVFHMKKGRLFKGINSDIRATKNGAYACLDNEVISVYSDEYDRIHIIIQ